MSDQEAESVPRMIERIEAFAISFWKGDAAFFKVSDQPWFEGR